MVSEKITGEIRIPQTVVAEIQKEIKNIPEYQEKIKRVLTARVTEVLEIIIGGAINLEVSDIHLEPGEKQTRIRVRIDGILQDVTSFDLKTHEVLLSRIKLISGIKLNITDRPQDGRFSVVIDDFPIEIRTSTLPAEHGESVVLRILNPKSLITLEALGLKRDLLEIVSREIKRPNGMVIVTGPTGSGKTTTLYAFLKKIQRPGIKIITIEDPIEYHLKEISQTQVAPRKGYDFASGLKSIMRQDPDVILVGEIRDLETVQIALQAALTGHLVLTTLHTNDAAGTVARLVSLGANPINIGPAINITIAQRLIRKACNNCLKLEKASEEDFKKLKKGLKDLPEKIKIPKLSKEIKIPQAIGCKSCNFTGFRGRIGIFEAFLIDDEIEKFIQTSPSIAGLRKLAFKKGMVSMKQDGLIKVLHGLTTIEEVERITGK